MFEDILVPTDGSDCTATAVGDVADSASRYGATVRALCGVDSRALDDAPNRERAGSHRETADVPALTVRAPGTTES